MALTKHAKDDIVAEISDLLSSSKMTVIERRSEMSAHYNAGKHALMIIVARVEIKTILRARSFPFVVPIDKYKIS